MPATSFSNLITFSRGTNATVTDSTGRLTYAPHNLLTFSEQFDNAAWTKSAATVTANVTTAPDGTITADKVVENTATDLHTVVRLGALTQKSVISLYAKAAERSIIGIGNASNQIYAQFDLSTGTIISSGANEISQAAIYPAGNGWYRISCVFTFTTSNRSLGIILYNSSGVNNYTGDGTSGLFIWGAQLEAVTYQTTPSTYYPTTVKNLLGYSQDFSNAAWGKVNVSITNCPFVNPVDGLFTAQKLMENTVNGLHYISLSAGTVGVTETLSVYAKAGERIWFVLQFGSNGTAYFNLETGALGTVTSGTASITAVGNGWYRCSFTGTRNTNQNNQIYTATANGTASYTGDGNSGIYIYGAQLSDSASLDPYVPTPAAAPSSTAYYGPRFDYDPVTLAPKGLLVEEARTNLFTYSEQFDNAAWLKTDLTVTPNAAVSPDGTMSADTLVENTANSTHFVYRLSAGTAGTYTYSFYAKANGRTEVQIEQESGGNSRFTLSGSGTALALGANTVSITSVGNGWYRCVTTFTATGAFGVYNLLYNGARSYLGNGTSGIFIYGAQLEAGAFATSYIPTVASTVTRSADVATITGSLFSGWYNQAQGTFLVNADAINFGVVRRNIQVDDGTGNERMYLGTNTSTNPYAVVVDGGVTQADMSATGTLSANTPYKITLAYAANDFALCGNGGTVTTDAAGTLPSPTLLRIGSSESSILLNGHIRSVQYIPNATSATQLQAATS